MHPLIRLHSLLVFIVLMALGGPGSLLVGLLLVTLLYFLSGGVPWRGLFKVLWRIRWLLLSILLLYGWWTPGTALPGLPPSYAPTREGLGEGLVRAGLLAAIVAAVHWVMMTGRRSELLGAVVALTRPLRWLGLPHERLAVRILLTLETVPKVQALVSETLRGDPVARSRPRDLAARARGIYGRVLAEAETAPLEFREVDAGGRVPRWQWVVPVVLALLLWSGRGFL